ncbi:putative chloride channel protein [Leptomonas seymouri]|uniref:Chloride channel protein n=1 Tax=Leptomonas seymouri TaxID=5684 RepID=A0A0N1IHR6_LEPSE|nr:putative chloride channel protein [Leptomonas seymouri]|eukprot:KPI83328.1 putative chloride channel protein [Leptomonas seymouri]
MRLPTNEFCPTAAGQALHGGESWLQWLIRTMRETANPNTMHTEDLTPVELAKQASFESLEYYKPYPDMYVEHLRESHKSRRPQYLDSVFTEGGSPSPSEVAVEQPSRAVAASSSCSVNLLAPFSTATSMQQVTEAFPILQMDEERRHTALRWLLHVLIALSVGIVATFVSYAVDFLEKYRADLLHRVMVRDGQHSFVGNMTGFLYTVAGSVFLVAAAAGVVVYFEPAASGGGIPDVMAYLNGVHLRKAMNLRTFIAKAISCICAVSGGLPVGLEAPLIHLGAITGAGVTQGRSRTLGFQTRLFRSFRNNKDRRDFITAGAACGVSVAFGSPIGGLLFVMEEVSSFWDQSSNGQIFLATMLCFTFSTMINSIVEDRRLLGWVSNAASVLFEVNLTIPLHLVSIVPSLLLGLIIGSMAAFFTKANLILIKWRRRVLRPYPLRRFLEPVVVGAAFSAIMFLMSLAAPCAEERVIDDVNSTIHIWGTEGAGRLFNNTCAKPSTYSPLGTLNMASGKNTIRHLFSRQTAGEFTVANLILYFFIYFGFAVVSSGTAVAGGLVVPSLVMGAVFGRLYGLLLFKMGATEMPGIPNSYAASDAWMDPGVFALIGAGAFLAGTSRMTMSICVIMVELSSELHYLLPVMVAIVMSKSTADWLCEPLYHQMMMMDSVPYLPRNIVKPEFEQLTAADVMASEVVMLRKRERTETVLAALRNSTHHAFPVVEAELDDLMGEAAQHAHGAPRHDSTGGWETTNNREGAWSSLSPDRIPTTTAAATKMSGPHSPADPSPYIRYKFVGLVTREDLQVYFTLPQLQEYNAASLPPSLSPVPLTADDSDGFGGRLAPCVLAIRRLSWQQWMAQKGKLFFATSDRYEWVRTHIPDGAPSGFSAGEESTSIISENRLPPVVDLSLIVNRSPWVIPPFFNLQMVYHTFRMMGLRHMVVVDGDTVAGIITRKDLLVDSLRRRMKELSARLATADSAAPSLPHSHSKRMNPTTHPPRRSEAEPMDLYAPVVDILRPDAGEVQRRASQQAKAGAVAPPRAQRETPTGRVPTLGDAALSSAATVAREEEDKGARTGHRNSLSVEGSRSRHPPPPTDSEKSILALSVLFGSPAKDAVEAGPARATPLPSSASLNSQPSSHAAEAARRQENNDKETPPPEAKTLFDLNGV